MTAIFKQDEREPPFQHTDKSSLLNIPQHTSSYKTLPIAGTLLVSGFILHFLW
jgi:hypothetical protein